MANLFPILTFLAILATALNAGLFFIFSVCIMAALARLPPAEGAAAMNAIDDVIQNPLFFSAFFGATLLSLVLAVLGYMQGSAAGLMAAAGGVVFVVAVFGVTVVFNVPLNDALAAAPAGSPEQATLWQRYLDVWVMWNHVRTLGSLVAVALLALAFRQGAQLG
nr:anthrone oxygenase family protein [uncultured Shinella sp.]